MFADLGHFSVRSIQVRHHLMIKLIMLLMMMTIKMIFGSDGIHLRGVPVPSLSLHGSSCLSNKAS